MRKEGCWKFGFVFWPRERALLSLWWSCSCKNMYGDNTGEGTLFIAEFLLFFVCLFSSCFSSLCLQSILIDACVLDSDSGLLQQVQTLFYLLFTWIHRYLMLDSLSYCKGRHYTFLYDIFCALLFWSRSVFICSSFGTITRNCFLPYKAKHIS